MRGIVINKPTEDVLDKTSVPILTLFDSSMSYPKGKSIYAKIKLQLYPIHFAENAKAIQNLVDQNPHVTIVIDPPKDKSKIATYFFVKRMHQITATMVINNDDIGWIDTIMEACGNMRFILHNPSKFILWKMGNFKRLDGIILTKEVEDVILAIADYLLIDVFATSKTYPPYILQQAEQFVKSNTRIPYKYTIWTCPKWLHTDPYIKVIHDCIDIPGFEEGIMRVKDMSYTDIHLLSQKLKCSKWLDESYPRINPFDRIPLAVASSSWSDKIEKYLIPIILFKDTYIIFGWNHDANTFIQVILMSH